MELKHYGILGQKWGIRRYQNSDGSLTTAGKKRAAKAEIKVEKAFEKVEEVYAKGNYFRERASEGFRKVDELYKTPLGKIYASSEKKIYDKINSDPMYRKLYERSQKFLRDHYSDELSKYTDITKEIPYRYIAVFQNYGRRH